MKGKELVTGETNFSPAYSDKNFSTQNLVLSTIPPYAETFPLRKEVTARHNKIALCWL